MSDFVDNISKHRLFVTPVDIHEASMDEVKGLTLGDSVMVNGKMGMFYGLQGSKVIVRIPGEGKKKVDIKDVEVLDLFMDDVGVHEEIEKDDDDPCWDGYVQLGTKMKDGKEVPNCVPMEEAKEHVKEELAEAALYSVNPTRGYNVMAVVAYKDPMTRQRKTQKIYFKTRMDALGFKDNPKGFPKGAEVETIKKVDESYAQKPVKENYDYPDYGPVGASEMKMTQLHFIKYAADEILKCLECGCTMPEWYQNKLAKVEGEVEGLLSYMKGKKAKEMSRRYSPGMYNEEVGVHLREAKEGGKEEYTKFFNATLKKFGVKSPAELKGEKEKEFYDYIDKNWTSDKEASGNYNESYMTEKLNPSDDVSKWIKDFKDSDAPQFKGKDAEERREMAVAAWLEARRKAGLSTPAKESQILDEGLGDWVKSLAKKVGDYPKNYKEWGMALEKGDKEAMRSIIDRYKSEGELSKLKTRLKNIDMNTKGTSFRVDTGKVEKNINLMMSLI